MNVMMVFRNPKFPEKFFEHDVMGFGDGKIPEKILGLEMENCRKMREGI
jgi:hypothetical protein